MAQQKPSPTSTSNSNSTSSPTSAPPSTPNPPPFAIDYKSLYHWEPDALLEETSSFNSLASIVAYRKKQTCRKSRVFGKDHDKFVRMVPRRVGEPVCSDESSDPEGPFCFVYSTVFRRLGLRLPFLPFVLFRFCVDMNLIAEKKKKSTKLLAERRAAAAEWAL